MNMDLTQEKTRMSYALGINMGEYLNHLPIEIEKDVLLQAMKDYFAGAPQLKSEEYHNTMQLFQQQMQQKAKDAIAKISQENREAETAFLATNRQLPDVVTTASGLQYKVMTPGNGPQPSAADTVRVHYTGMLLDGRVFDSSVKRGQPAEFGVNQVIPGWAEALQLMPVGSKYKLFIPAALAYGERGAGEAIPPNAMLLFEVELLEIL
ncbi:FKBP-type peptidyl-prolyl cis-trans isomerase [Victivallis sp. Marseille-Q1083]|uniref:FKBP-type peptidyl-prolyl cis-trans isomerase n=1 Tax=Victivallis sp. Marseille-Q1083 TaxID=2717288 RepID=UPI00158F6647|nr:FKBP-type peptidyl-prolyl cis-trans isomerase [Victivallis sp. Marseille-Q1083]